ncbi:MAG: type I secretion system permease/ATPase [Gammaproteobacteria bacterium]|nr:type I secretion system permease/ATPase [Gammaproteobacteria bacterium]
MHTRDMDVDSGLACLVRLAHLLGVATDPARLRHEFAPDGAPFTARDIVRAAQWLGLKARRLRSDWSRLARTPLPALIRERGGGWALLAGVRSDGVLVQAPGGSPEVLDRAAFLARWSGDLVLCTRRAAASGTGTRFGFGWFLPALLAHRGLLVEVLVASFVLQLFALAAPVCFQVIVDKVLVHRGLATLDVLCLGLLLLSLFEVVLTSLRTYVLQHTTTRIDVTLGARAFRHLLQLPSAWFEARRVGDTVARMRELDRVRRFLTGAALTLAIDLVFVGVFIAAMCVYSPTLALVVIASLPCYGALAFAITPLLRRRLDEQFDRGAEAQAFLVESVAGIETLKAAAVEPRQAARWDELLAAAATSDLRTQTLSSVAGQAAAAVQKLCSVLTLWLGARLVIDGALSVGELIAFNLFAARVTAPLLKLVQLWHEYQQAGVSVERIGDLLNAPPEQAHGARRLPLPALAGAIRFERVDFRYRADRSEVLRDLSFDIAAGQFIGIVGASGSGKSTITKLIQRLHVPQAGRVLIDGQDLAVTDPAWLRSRIGVVLQENRLFNRSVRENIALRDPALPLERVIEAATLAGAHGFILELPEGYDTVVGEFGATLSGGQRQRIALARALVTAPRILILDEATSALDYESEALIQANMRRIVTGRTVIVIAHRLSAVRHADCIFVIERGSLVERGTHRELLARNGRYARLHRLQGDGAVVTPIGS